MKCESLVDCHAVSTGLDCLSDTWSPAIDFTKQNPDGWCAMGIFNTNFYGLFNSTLFGRVTIVLRPTSLLVLYLNLFFSSISR